MKFRGLFLSFCAFSAICGVFWYLTPDYSAASGPSPVPFLPTFSTGAPSTPPAATNQAYVETNASNAAWFYNAATKNWVQISNGSASSCPGGSGGQIQINSGAGSCNGITNVQLTADVNLATTSLSGALPSGGTSSAQYFGGDYAFHTLPASGITINTTTISGGTSGRVLFDNAATVGELTNIQLTADINLATASLSGAVPSGGTSSTQYFGGDYLFHTLPASGSPCTSTANALQYNNAGAFGCAPEINNSGVSDFTPAASAIVWQVNGTLNYTLPGTTNFGVGPTTLSNFSGGATSKDNCGGFAACLNDTTSADNTGFGYESCGASGTNWTGGGQSSCFGEEAGFSLRGTAGPSDYFGYFAGAFNTGNDTVGIGWESCGGNGTLSASPSDVCVGRGAGAVFNAAQNNTLIGDAAGGNITTGNANLCLGLQACKLNTALTTGSNNIVLNATTTGNCGLSANNVSNEFDLCGNTSGTNNAIVRCAMGSLSAGNCKFGVVDSSPAFTVSTLPAGPPTGSRAYVSDAVACTFLAAPTGGGSAFCPVIYNGTTWVAS